MSSCKRTYFICWFFLSQCLTSCRPLDAFSAARTRWPGQPAGDCFTAHLSSAAALRAISRSGWVNIVLIESKKAGDILHWFINMVKLANFGLLPGAGRQSDSRLPFCSLTKMCRSLVTSCIYMPRSRRSLKDKTVTEVWILFRLFTKRNLNPSSSVSDFF